STTSASLFLARIRIGVLLGQLREWADPVPKAGPQEVKWRTRARNQATPPYSAARTLSGAIPAVAGRLGRQAGGLVVGQPPGTAFAHECVGRYRRVAAEVLGTK